MTDPRTSADSIAEQVRPELTAEEQAFFDAEHDLTAALTRAHDAATKALKQQVNHFLLDDASHAFALAAGFARTYHKEKGNMDKAFKQSDEYKAQGEAE